MADGDCFGFRDWPGWFDFRFLRHPPLWSVHVLAVAIYINFFAHHYIADIRYLLFAAAALLFARAWIYYKIWRVHRRMPQPSSRSS